MDSECIACQRGHNKGDIVVSRRTMDIEPAIHPNKLCIAFFFNRIDLNY